MTCEHCSKLAKANRDMADRTIAAEAQLKLAKSTCSAAMARFRLARSVCAEAVPLLEAITKDGCSCSGNEHCVVCRTRNLIGRMQAIARQ